MQKGIHKITAALLAMLLLCGIGSFAVSAEQDYDIDGDGDVSINDVTILQMYLAAYNVGFSDYQKSIADVNGDGITDINDATDLQRLLLTRVGKTDKTDTYILEAYDTQIDSDYSGTVYPLTDEEREFIEKVVMGEFGISYEGSVCVAQCIRDALVYGYCKSPMDLTKPSSQGGMGYVGFQENVNQDVKNAVEFVFDYGGSAVQHRMLVMCTESYYNNNPGNWHSTQNFIVQYKNVLFFDYWA